MELVRDEGDGTFNELLQEVQQQFLWYREKSSKKLVKLEELIDLANQKRAVTISWT